MKLIALLLFLTFTISIQPIGSQQNTTPLLGDQDEIVVPFDYNNGFIIVDLVFQKVLPLKFILDTGAENTILLKRDYADALKVPYHKKIKILGSDMSQDVHAFICNSTFIQLVNTQRVIHNLVVLAEDYMFLEEFVGTKIDGILGAEFFKGYVIKIDYRRKMLTIYNAKKYDASKLKKFYTYDIELLQNKPYLNCITEVNAGQPVKTKLLIDTGAALSALFHNNTDTLLKTNGVIVKGNLGKGLGGALEGFSGKVHRLELGELFFTNMISSFQDLDSVLIDTSKILRNGLLGNILLERFEMILDFNRSKLYLKPSKKYNESFEFDKSGLTIFSFGPNLDKFYVKYVIENSPAHEADIRPGDIIQKVGCFSYKWYSLKQLNKKFSGKTGKRIKLKIIRNGKKLKKELVLKDLLAP